MAKGSAVYLVTQSRYSLHSSLSKGCLYLVVIVIWLKDCWKRHKTQIKQTHRIWSNYSTYPYKRTVKKFHTLQITASILFLYFFIKAYVVGTHLNCIDLSMQFKWVHTTYAFMSTHNICLYKENQKKSHYHHQINPILIFYSVPLLGRFILYHNWVFPVFLKNLSTQSGN